MTVLSEERFMSGMTWNEYLAHCKEHFERRQQGYASVSFTEEQEQTLAKLRPLGLKVLVLEEDWCGDAARSGPILAKIAEQAGMEARWFLRDQNLDIMDQYLENGKSRSIPVFVFMDKDRNYLSHWGSRPAAVKEAIQPLLPLPPMDDPARPAAFDHFRKVLGEAYEKNYPHGIVDELLEHIVTALDRRNGS